MLGLLLMLTATHFAPIDASLAPTQFAAAPNGSNVYDAIDGGTRRVTVGGSHKSEDRLLLTDGRKRLAGNARDLTRNFSVVAWAVRRHLDYVTQFTFHAVTKDKGFNKALEELIDADSRRERFDTAGRHSLARAIRLLEAHATIDGDAGFVKLSNGTCQGLEGDRVKTPQIADINPDEWEHGVKLNDARRASAYAVHRRTRGENLEFERMVPAANMLWHGTYNRFDQVRGISPITSALNLFRDVHENFDYALVKAKITQIFGIKIMRASLNDESPGQLTGGVDANDDEDKSAYNVDFGKGPVVVDMDRGDDLGVIESATPSTQFQAFTELAMMAALKGLDIPFSFYDESHTNFFGSKGAWFHYERSCKTKRDALAELLDAWTLWRLQLHVLDNELSLPSGAVLSDLNWLWVPRGTPWWDPSKEVIGDLRAIGAGLDNPQRICREKDRGDFYDNCDKIAEAIEYAKALGLTLNFDPGAQPQTIEVNTDAQK